MQEQYALERVAGTRGLPVYPPDAEKIGEVEELYYGETTNEPEWISLGLHFRTTRTSVTVPSDKVQLLIEELAATEGGNETIPLVENRDRSGTTLPDDAKAAVLAAINAIGMRRNGLLLLGPELLALRDELMNDLDITPFDCLHT